MSVSFGNAIATVNQTWTTLKTTLFNKGLSLQWDLDGTGTFYQLFAIDGSIVYTSFIYLGTVPAGIVSTYSQAQNNADLADFQSNFQALSNQPVTPYQRGDDRWIYRLGNATFLTGSELVVGQRLYTEPQAQAQRSVVSTSANDTNGGSGAGQIRLTFLNSNYTLKTEDIFLSGTTAVNTVNTDIHYVESMQVIKGTAAAGAVKLMTLTGGLGSEICGIGSGTDNTELCHHYIPSGSQAQVIHWNVSTDASVLMRLKGQLWTSGNLVDPIILDLESMAGIVSGSTVTMDRDFLSMPLQEKTYVRVTAQPQQSAATLVRARLNVWQDYLYVSGTR